MDLLKPPKVVSLIHVSLLLRLNELLRLLALVIDLPFPCQQPLLVVLLSFVEQISLDLQVYVHDVQAVSDEPVFDVLVKRGVGCERRSVIHLNQQRVALLIEHNVEPQYMEAHVPRILFGLAMAILVVDGGHPRQDRFDNDVIDFRFQQFHILALLFQQLVDRSERSLVADVHVPCARIEYEIGIQLVYRVVRQMDTHVVHVRRIGLFVWNCREPRQSLIVDVSPERRSRQQHINPEVEFQPVDQVGFRHIPLYHIMPSILKILYVSREEDPSSLAVGFRLDDVGAGPARLGGLVKSSEFGVLGRQHPRRREELVLIGKQDLHAHQVHAQQILPCDQMYPWKMVDFLVKVHPDEYARLDGEVRPAHIPVPRLLVLLHHPPEIPRHLRYHRILRHFVKIHLQATLMMIFFRFTFSFSSLSILGLCSSSGVSSSELHYETESSSFLFIMQLIKLFPTADQLITLESLQLKMYERLGQDETETFFQKFYRYIYPIISISLLNYTMSNTYSLMVNHEQATGFISIIVSSVVCFFLSQSHLTIYGISILSIVYFQMLSDYSEQQKSMMTFLAGLIQLIFWKVVHVFRDIYHYLPGKVHSGMILGIGCIVLAKFFPLAIQNVNEFYNRGQSFFENPLQSLKAIFSEFNLITLILVIVITLLIFFLRRKLARFPTILIFALIGIILSYITTSFKSYKHLCEYQLNGVKMDCSFYIINLNNFNIPKIEELFELIPASFVLTMILIFEQFLYIEEFQRNGRKYKGEGDLGDTEKQSKVLCISNMLCGLVGGLPVCINLFTTYENYSFTKKYGFRGSKVVGISQIFFNYLLYSVLSPAYMRIPLFVIYCIIMIPLVYFFKTVYRYSFKEIRVMIALALLNVLTHPVFALIVGAFLSIYEMAQMLKPSPAEILIGGGTNQVVVRESTTFERMQEQKTGDEILAKIIAIDDDIPIFPTQESYVLYRFTGAVTYLNFYMHVEEIADVVSKNRRKSGKKLDDLYDNIIFSFRYVQNIDSEALEGLSYLVKQIKSSNRKQVVLITGLHSTLLSKISQSAYFMKMLEEEERVFYRLHGKNLQ